MRSHNNTAETAEEQDPIKHLQVFKGGLSCDTDVGRDWNLVKDVQKGRRMSVEAELLNSRQFLIKDVLTAM